MVAMRGGRLAICIVVVTILMLPVNGVTAQEQSNHPAVSIDWGANGLIALGTADGYIKITDANATVLSQWQVGTSAIWYVKWEPSATGNRVLFVLPEEMKFSVIDVVTGTRAFTVPNIPNAVVQLGGEIAWSPDGSKVIGTELRSGSYETNGVFVLDASSGETVADINDQYVGNAIFGPLDIAWHPNNSNLLAIGYAVGIVELWDVSTNTRLLDTALWDDIRDGYGARRIRDIGWTADGDNVVVSVSNWAEPPESEAYNTIRVLDAESLIQKVGIAEDVSYGDISELMAGASSNQFMFIGKDKGKEFLVTFDTALNKVVAEASIPFYRNFSFSPDKTRVAYVLYAPAVDFEVITLPPVGDKNP